MQANAGQATAPRKPGRLPAHVAYRAHHTCTLRLPHPRTSRCFLNGENDDPAEMTCANSLLKPRPGTCQHDRADNSGECFAGQAAGKRHMHNAGSKTYGDEEMILLEGMCVWT